MDVGVAVELVDDQFDDAVQQNLFAGDVAVEGHRIDAEVGTKSPHAQFLQPPLVDEGHCSMQDLLPTQAMAALTAARLAWAGVVSGSTTSGVMATPFVSAANLDAGQGERFMFEWLGRESVGNVSICPV